MKNTEPVPITRAIIIAILTAFFTTRIFLPRVTFFKSLLLSARLAECVAFLSEVMFTAIKSSSTVKNKIVERAYNSGLIPFFNCV